MIQKLPNMLDTTIEKIRQLVNVNSVVGEPITIQDGLTIIPISKISVGLGGGGTDFVSKNPSKENPFGGGIAAGIKAVPVAFLVIKDGSVRMLPIAAPANTTADRLVEMIPDTLDKIVSFIDSHTGKKEE